jgi:hypothetical protein
MDEARKVYRFSVSKLLGSIHLEDLKGNGRITLRWL